MILTRRHLLIACGALLGLVVLPSAQAFASHPQQRRQQTTSSSLFLTTSSDNSPQKQQQWLDKGLLLSSFTDGLQSNPEAQDWLCHALVENLWKEEQHSVETCLSNSNEFSPCNGPDINMWEQLEDIDEKVNELYPNKDVGESDPSSWRQSLAELQKHRRRQHTIDQPLELRIVYIPTALYALRKDSNNTPGKQRQRARADGKKRRNAIVEMLSELMGGESVAISAVTMDFDDGSVKQPESSTVVDNAVFPKTGMQAIQDWKPHVIYVQGGNTFWLHHCMKKGGWEEALIEACCVDRNNDERKSHKAVYIGVSAGAILAGKSMQTACWKGWDDPSVVLGMETYDDWTNVSGLALSGTTSFFPHMEDQWQPLVEERIQALPQDCTADDESPILCCLRDEEVCYVEGRKSSIQSTATLRSRTPAPVV